MSIIVAREKFLRRQIERAWEIAEHYRALNDPISAAWFEDWVWRVEFELEQRGPIKREELQPGSMEKKT